MHILFCRHIWAELSLLFLTFLSGTLFPGGGVHVHPVHPPPPPAYAPVNQVVYCSYWSRFLKQAALVVHLTGVVYLKKKNPYWKVLSVVFIDQMRSIWY